LRITFLGSGGAFTDYRVNYHNNALVDTEEGPVLLDCGTTAAQSLRELGVHATALRAILFTHLHADHASPEQLIWERMYLPPHPGEGPAFAHTELVGPEDLIDPLCRSLEPFLDPFSDPHGEARSGAIEALLRRHRTQETEIGGVRFRWFRVPHVVGAHVDKAAYGIEIRDRHRRVWWSGDTTFSPGWIAEAAEADRIFHECMFARPFRGTVHTHFAELCTLPASLRGQVTLMHHTAVPEGQELTGFAGAARRHEVFDLG
jgi:ribonuclease BN (tRNA processing enzyme)